MASKLRPECGSGNGVALPEDTALYLIRDAVNRRRSLAYGRLHDKDGRSCAMGAFWDDNPKLTVSWKLLDEVAAVNDSLPPTATPKERWKKVQSWLRFKIKSLTSAQRGVEPK
jgi:hypothetical protein